MLISGLAKYDFNDEEYYLRVSWTIKRLFRENPGNDFGISYVYHFSFVDGSLLDCNIISH